MTQFYAIFSPINVQKYFAWLSFRSFPAGMPIFSQIRVGHVTWEGDSLVHPLLKAFQSPMIDTAPLFPPFEMRLKKALPLPLSPYLIPPSLAYLSQYGDDGVDVAARRRRV